MTSGKSAPHGLPVAGFGDSGPVEPKQLPRLLTPTTKKRSVSSGLPGPDHVVPPADVVGVVRVVAGDVMRRVERMADEHRVRARRRRACRRFRTRARIAAARAAGERQRRVEARACAQRPRPPIGPARIVRDCLRSSRQRRPSGSSATKNPACFALTGLVSGGPLPLRFSRIFRALRNSGGPAPASWLKSAQGEFSPAAQPLNRRSRHEPAAQESAIGLYGSTLHGANG